MKFFAILFNPYTSQLKKTQKVTNLLEPAENGKGFSLDTILLKTKTRQNTKQCKK